MQFRIFINGQTKPGKIAFQSLSRINYWTDINKLWFNKLESKLVYYTASACHGSLWFMSQINGQKWSAFSILILEWYQGNNIDIMQYATLEDIKSTSYIRS